MDGYIILDRSLGSGAYSVVHLALDLKAQKQVACKIIKRARISDDGTQLEREIKLMKTVKHPNLNALLHANLDHDPERIFLFLHLMTGGDLFSYLANVPYLQDYEAKFSQSLDWMILCIANS